MGQGLGGAPLPSRMPAGTSSRCLPTPRFAPQATPWNPLEETLPAGLDVDRPRGTAVPAPPEARTRSPLPGPRRARPEDGQPQEEDGGPEPPPTVVQQALARAAGGPPRRLPLGDDVVSAIMAGAHAAEIAARTEAEELGGGTLASFEASLVDSVLGEILDEQATTLASATDRIAGRLWEQETTLKSERARPL